MEKIRPNRFRAFLSLFECEFSIDWIIDLTDKKPSEVLKELEKGLQEGWLEQSGNGFYRLSGKKSRLQFSDYYNLEEKRMLHQKIADYLIQEFTNIEQLINFLTPHLLSITNDIFKSDILVKIGDLYRKKYRNEKGEGKHMHILANH